MKDVVLLKAVKYPPFYLLKISYFGIIDLC